MMLDLQSLFGFLCSAVLIGWDPATHPEAPAFGLIHKGGAIGQPRQTTFLCNPTYVIRRSNIYQNKFDTVTSALTSCQDPIRDPWSCTFAKVSNFFSLKANKCYFFVSLRSKNKFVKAKRKFPAKKSEKKRKEADKWVRFVHLSARIGSETNPISLHFASKRNFIFLKQNRRTLVRNSINICRIDIVGYKCLYAFCTWCTRP